MGISGVNEVDGGIPSKDPLGTVISTGHGSRSIKARLHAEK
jgi:hypothetical protein